MKIKLIHTIFLLGLLNNAYAQVNIENNDPFSNTTQQETEATDSTKTDNDEAQVYDNLEPVLTQEDIDYMNKLSAIQSIVPLDYNKYVKRYIEVYTYEKRDKLANILGRQDKYFPLFERVFLQYNIPLEMKYLSVIESALNPNAVSRSGAGGLWQFMPATGRLMGLKQDTWIDERRDPYKATVAAAQYLNELYSKFGNWHLVMASYNCGPGCIGRTISRLGMNNFWEMRPHLRTETANYVPAFIGATYAMNYSGDHQVFPNFEPYYYEPADEVLTNTKITLKAIAQYIGESEDQLSFMNPELIKDCTPPYAYNLRLPVGKTSLFQTMYDSIIAYKPIVMVDSSKLKQKKTVATDDFSNFVPKGKKLQYHTVKKGETLSSIADKWDVSLSSIKQWNKMSDNTVGLGEKLKIYSNKKINTQEAKSTHTVKKGETLSSIAKKYGTTSQAIKELNNMKSNTVDIGQVLKVNTKKSSNKDNVASSKSTKTNKENSKSNIAKTYTVRKGDTLNEIASKHDMSLAELRQKNKLKTTSVKPGQILKVN